MYDRFTVLPTFAHGQFVRTNSSTTSEGMKLKHSLQSAATSRYSDKHHES